ncbi:K(+) efflux antiporter 6-like [Phoenix dactylifera]|uniref:K(+) efflux antiporter 6-like n=1 Tax=Phoenix dactylifera TaxID=42345 RepID=A0A8B9AUP4_PHODC|nr:K(+) efflux antiporter 6-like [Phoenix dactylifera]
MSCIFSPPSVATEASRAAPAHESFADMIDQALRKEFPESEQTVGGNLETVAGVTSKKNDTKEKLFQFLDVVNLDNENLAEDSPTLIDHMDNVFIISNPRLISDLVVVIVSATCGGIAF